VGFTATQQNRENGVTTVGHQRTFLQQVRKLTPLFVLPVGCLFIDAPHANPRTDRPVTRPPETAVVQIPSVSRAPHLEDFLQMRPDTEWEGKLTRVGGFIQRAPDDGQPATQPTEVYFGYDQRNLYVIFVAHDAEPKKIRARLDRREGMASDEDQVGIYIDTFLDKRHAYQFECNPLGVQDDSIRSEDTDSWDESFDTVWESRGKVTPQGYIVWMSIPFRSLRFRHATSQEWGVLVWRFVGRRSEGSFWPRTTSRIRSFVGQEAPIGGIEHISPSRNLQFIPHINWRAFHAVDTRDPANPCYSNSSAEIMGGVDAKAILKDSVVLDLTAKPDFSQIESDEPQITTNQRYKLYYPEKRPFFTENASYFDVPMAVPSQHLLFTRTIADPDFGIRLTGKEGSYSIGVLFADDRSPGESVPASDPVSGKRAYFDVLRITHDLPSRSNIGVTFAAREFAGSHSRVADLDATINVSKTWKAAVMAGYNWNRSLDGSAFSGGDVDASLTRVSRGFNYIGYFLDRAPGFQPAMAFYNHSNWREIGQTFAYQFWPRNKWITRIWSEVYAARNWHFNGDLNWEGVSPTVKVDVKHNTTVTGYVWMWHDAFGPQDFVVLHQVHKFPLVPAYGIAIKSTQARFLNFKVSAEWGTRSNVLPPAGQAPTQAHYQQAEADLILLTSRGLTVTNTYLFDHNANLGGGAIYNAHIALTNWNWQLNRELSFRFIGQYNAVVANPLFTSTPTGRAFNADFLITYLVHPGTAVYIGYNSNLSSPGPDIVPVRPGFVNDGRQFFVEVSYLLRF
jgi:hypothetical protein